MRSDPSKKPAVLAAAVLSLSLSALAQTTNGALEGKISDEAGKPVVGALVEVRGPALQAFLGSATDLGGDYKFPFVPAGRGYEVRVEATGFATVVRRGIDIPLGVTVSLPFTLGPGKSEVVVTAPAPTVDIKSTTSGASIAGSMISTVPLRRDYNELAFLAPSAAPGGYSTPSSPSISGSTGAENNYLINGLDVTNAGMGTTAQALNFDFIQEMQVLTGGLSPEYGAAMGGVVNAITRSGGNEFHGSVFAYYWSDKTQAKSVTYPYIWTLLGNDGYERYDMGATLGGYLVKDRLWFYLAYDYNSIRSYTDYPREPQYGDPYLYLNGAPAQSYFAGRHFTNDSTINPMYALKLTWNASPSQKVAFSFFGNDSRENAVWTLSTIIPETAEAKQDWSYYNLAVQWNSTWSPTFFSELDLGYRHRTWKLYSDTASMDTYQYSYMYGGFQVLPKDQAMAPVSANGIQLDLGSNYLPSTGAGGVSSLKGESFQARLKLTNLLSGSAGRHELSYGLQYQDYDQKDETTYSGPGTFVSPSTHQPVTGLTVGWFGPRGAGPHGELYRYQAYERLSPSQGSVSEKYGAAWVNDRWSITDYFTLQLGLRYDEEKFTGGRTGTSFDLTDNWAPRLGFTWDIKHDGKSKFFGFLGRYFERMPAGPANTVLNETSFGFERFYDPQLTEWTGYTYDYGTAFYIQGQTMPPASRLTPTQTAAYSHPLKAPYTDEWILGYEYQLRPDLTLGARVIYRELTRALDDLSYDGGETFVLANPEYWTDVPVPSALYLGTYGYYPKPIRRYEALELTLDKRYSDRWQLSGSLVYSRLKGNYEGVATNDYQGGWSPNMNAIFDLVDTTTNGYGFLPLDRTWVMKAYGSYFFEGIPVHLSGALNIMSGTPISKMISMDWIGYGSFATQRGTYGRLPWTWTLDVGIQYDFKLPMKSALGLRVDVFNVFNQQKPTAVYQWWKYQSDPGGPLYYWPLFGKPYEHQPPRTARLALRWTF